MWLICEALCIPSGTDTDLRLSSLILEDSKVKILSEVLVAASPLPFSLVGSVTGQLAYLVQ